MMPERDPLLVSGLACTAASALAYLAFLVTATAEAIRSRRTPRHRRGVRPARGQR